MADDGRFPADALLIEAASLCRLLGGVGSKHLIIVGGLVPPLLAPNARTPHLGSRDVDLCLSVAITEGATREYYKSIQELIEPYFEPASANGSRWRKKAGVPGLPLLVDFLAPELDDEMPLSDGTRERDDPTAAANTGVRLRPYLIRAGALVDEDAETVVLEDVPLVYRNGALDSVQIRFAGPVGFFAAKADALPRSERKDCYDMAWVCINAAPTPREVAQQLIRRPAFKDPDFAPRVADIANAFKTPDHVGPEGYAALAFPELAPGDEDYDRARNEAFAAVDGVVGELKQALHDLWEDIGSRRPST